LSELPCPFKKELSFGDANLKGKTHIFKLPQKLIELIYSKIDNYY
jgi:hypothetical protein